MKREVTFAAADGTLLRGDLYAPDVASRAIVMAHGFSGVKEQIEAYAASFATAGFATLVYDHRGFGASDGTPRREVDAFRQIADWRDAISFVRVQPEVLAASRVGIWGSSFAGGLALVLAANDERVGCVVAQIPHVGGRRNGRETFDVARRDALRRRLADDRAARFAGAEPARVPVFSADSDVLCALPPALSRRSIEAAVAAAPAWANDVTLRSIENMLEFEPAGWIPYVAPTPLLMIVAANDACTFAEHQLDAFERAKQPKALLVHPGGHFDTYAEQLGPTSEAAVRWFREHLTGDAPFATEPPARRVPAAS